MGVPMNVLAYILWVGKPDGSGREGYYINDDIKITYRHDMETARKFPTREDAEGFMLIHSTKEPDLIGAFEIRAIVVGFAIRYQKTNSEEVNKWSEPAYTINQTKVMYVGAHGSIVGSLDEAAKFRTSEKAEEISFNMALKDKTLLGAMEVVEIHHIQKG
jgi:hypothetical protein